MNCEHPNHVEGESCEDHAVACKQACVCCLPDGGGYIHPDPEIQHQLLVRAEEEEQRQYEAGVEAIRARNLSISDAIIALVDLYKNLYGKTPYQINCGDCEDFGVEIESLFPKAVGDWGDGFWTWAYENKPDFRNSGTSDDDADKYAYHYIIEYQGKFYDAEHPNGVEDFRTISAFSSTGEKQFNRLNP